MVKLILDRAVAELGLLILALPMLAVAVLFKLDSLGPVLHRQVRDGRRGLLLAVYRFRSTAGGAENLQDSLARSTGQGERPVFELRRRVG